MPANFLVLVAVLASIALGWGLTKAAIHLTLTLLRFPANTRTETGSAEA